MQQRGGDGGKKRKRSPPKKESPDRKVYPHPVYGDIPMLPVEIQIAPGKTHTYQDFDPDFSPPMPRGAVRGDVRKQDFCRMCHVPRYFFVDQERRCVQCNQDFLFSAAEQKYWYETLKFHFDSVAIRCQGCRRERRSDKALHRQLAATLALLEKNPEDRPTCTTTTCGSSRTASFLPGVT